MAADGDGLNEPPEPTSAHSPRAWRIVGGLTLLLSLSFFVPWNPYIIATAGIDDSWMLALNALFRQAPRFGHDLVFTYGPWGFLNTRAYHPDTYGLMLLAWSFFSLAFWRGCWAVGRRRIANPAVMLVWMLATLGIAALEVFHQIAAPLCLVGLLLVYCFSDEHKPFSGTLVLLVAAVAWASLVKFTYFFAAGLVIVPVSVDQLRRRQVPSVALLFSGSMVLFDLLAGQRLADLPSYLRLSLQGMSGYTDAMSCTTVYHPIPGMTHLPPLDLVCFVAAASLLMGTAIRAQCHRDGAWGLLPLTALAATLFITFKWGFVRHDAFHTPLAACVLLFLGLLAAAWLWPERKTDRGGRLALAAAVLAGAAVSWDSLASATGIGMPNYYAISLLGDVGPNLRAAAQLARGTSHLSNDYEHAMAAIRSGWPVPTIEGSVDIYPSRSAVPIAAGLQYAPRPVFQSYCAYTEELAALNADHLRGPNAPAHLLLGISDGGFPLDRFPTADDGPSWPEFLTRYEIERITPNFLVLRKAARPGHYEFTPFGHTDGRLNASIPIPSVADGPVWVRIRFEPTAAGKILALLYKSPELYFSVTTRDGRTRVYRTSPGSPGSAAAGFLLSPLIDDIKAYDRLAHHLPLTGNEVKTITLMERGWIGQGWTFRPNISVTFSRLTFSEGSVLRPDEGVADRIERGSRGAEPRVGRAGVKDVDAAGVDH